MSHLRLVGLLGRHRWVLLPLVGLGLLVAATWAAQALVTARVFAVVLEPEGGPTVATLAPLLAALAAVLVVRPLLVLAREVVATALMGRVKTDLRDRLAELLTRRTARAAGRGRTGHDHAVLVDGVENLDPYLGRYVPQVAVTVLTMLAVATVMAVIDPVVAGVVVLGGAVVLALPHAWEAALARRGADHWEAYSTLHADFVDSMQGMTTLVTFGAAERRQRALAAASQRLLASTLRQLRLSLLESGLNGFALAAVPVVAVAVVLARRDTLDVFSGFALVLLAVELVRPLKDLASLWHAGYLGTFSGREVATALAATDLDRPADWRPAAQLALRGVTLTHVDGRSAALVDVDLAVEPGLTAVVGPSGGGKSTLVGVLAGLHRPDSGVLEAPDDPLRHVALVPQDPVLLAGTVAENIAAGLMEPVADPHTDAQVVLAATTAGIGTDDPSLTLDSPVGERGQLLSGGQRQRVAIARGLAQSRAVLVLDEATSALDGRSEERLLRRLRDTIAGGPLLLVAHRPAVVAAADRVVEVASGRVSRVDHRVAPADVGVAL